MLTLLTDRTWQHRLVRVETTSQGTPVVFAIHTWGSGISLGGCRMLYNSTADDALFDAMRLSRGMTYKAAAAGLTHGGGKCVIAVRADSLTGQKRRETLLEVGDLIESFHGRFFTGADANTDNDDARTLRERTTSIVGVPDADRGVGDPSALTALGVIVAIETALTEAYGSPDFSGRSVAVLGLGKVGGDVARIALSRGAEVRAGDINPAKAALAVEMGATWMPPEKLVLDAVDVFAPCAMGGIINSGNVGDLKARIIAGSANNQLAEPGLAEVLRSREIIYAPDFIANAGGMISVAGEIDGYTEAEATSRTKAIGTSLAEVFEDSRNRGITTVEAAEQLAMRRLEAAR